MDMCGGEKFTLFLFSQLCLYITLCMHNYIRFILILFSTLVDEVIFCPPPHQISVPVYFKHGGEMSPTVVKIVRMSHVGKVQNTVVIRRLPESGEVEIFLEGCMN